MKIYAFILCAGFGKRLSPLTDHFPKPLLEVAGKCVLDRIIEKLLAAGAEKIGINAHHLPEMLKRHVESSPFSDRLIYFYENEILETGGGLVNAKSFLAEADSFIVHNGDIVSDVDVKALLEKHLMDGNTATLATLEGPENRVMVNRKDKVIDMRGTLGTQMPEDGRLVTFCGIAAYSAKIFRHLPFSPSRISVVDGLLDAIKNAPGTIGAYSIPKATYWTDIGTVKQYFDANMRLSPSGVSISREAVCENGANVAACVLLPGAHVSYGEYRSREIIGADFSCPADWAELSQISIIDQTERISALAQQGSARRFFRIGDTKALMISFDGDADFDRFVTVGRFFAENNLHTPALYDVDKTRFAVTMEFLGFKMLYNSLVETKSDDERYELYSKAIDALADFQSRGTALVRKHPELSLRDFDYDYLRWETTYFRENMLEKVCGLELAPSESTALERELDDLAKKCLAMPQTLIHRDFQSQNIMIFKDSARFIDFQGARMGAYTYDIMSLVKDPYYPVAPSLRKRLLERHRQAVFADVPMDKYLTDACLASLQRNMQCLGAYGFLWLVKGKTRYSGFIRGALEELNAALNDVKGMEMLKKLSKRALDVCEKRIRKLLNP